MEVWAQSIIMLTYWMPSPPATSLTLTYIFTAAKDQQKEPPIVKTPWILLLGGDI